MFTAPLPGGTAVIRTASELTVAARRALQVRLLMFGADRFRQVIDADSPDSEVLAEQIGLTAAETDALEGIADVTMAILLDSWDLPDPVPRTPAQVRALPAHLRGALADVTAAEGDRAIRAAL